MFPARPKPLKTSLTMTFLIGSMLGPAATPAQACDEQEGNAMNSETLHEQIRGDMREKTARIKDKAKNMDVASQATKANASASASASAKSSADGNGDCTAESSASAETRAGDQHQWDYDSDRERSSDGDCRASSESKASAGADSMDRD